MKSMILACIQCIAFTAIPGCQGNTIDPDMIPDNAQTGTLRVQLGSESVAADLDPAVSEVWVRLQTVLIRHDVEGWVDLIPDRQDLNLLESAEVVASAEVYVGLYDKLQFLIADTWIVVDGVEEELSFTGDVDVLDPLELGLVVEPGRGCRGTDGRDV